MPFFKLIQDDDDDDEIKFPAMPIAASSTMSTSSRAIDVDGLTAEQSEIVRRTVEQNRLFVKQSEERRINQRLSFLRGIFPYLVNSELTLALSHCDDDDVISICFFFFDFSLQKKSLTSENFLCQFFLFFVFPCFD